jgi:hypothetical protein
VIGTGRGGMVEARSLLDHGTSVGSCCVTRMIVATSSLCVGMATGDGEWMAACLFFWFSVDG